MKISFKHKGDFYNTEKLLKGSQRNRVVETLHYYGREGIRRLETYTPKDTGLTSRSWGYGINSTKKGYQLYWYNTNVQKGNVVAILIQYGHGTRHGAYVQGRDYINPALLPTFDSLSNDLWKEMRGT